MSFGRNRRAAAGAEPETSGSPAATVTYTDQAPKAPGNVLAPRSRAARETIRTRIFERIDPAVAMRMSHARLKSEVETAVGDIAAEEGEQISPRDQQTIAGELLDDMMGIGPIEPLLSDDSVTDILVNGPGQIYVERNGRLERTELAFRDAGHLVSVAQRIAANVGRRVDESSPMVDARLKDGSRVNIIMPPLALDGAAISIRKFAKKRIDFEVMVTTGSVSPELARVLEVASASRLNVLISGGTGSGKTTMLNAMSRLIDTRERIVTIEDAAELQLQQPHVVRLETRPPNLEGQGAVTQRELMINALRMRPDRIILGEVRGAEAFDMLQAMNTGHDGSMCTLHANTPRDALTRLENMLMMANANLPARALRQQVAGAIDLIVQVERMRDGVRRVTHLTEIVGMEGEVVTTQDLFTYAYEGETAEGALRGHHASTGVRPHFQNRAQYFGLERKLQAAMAWTGER